MNINFGYRTFKWSNEAKGKAAVFCVIVGFSEKIADSKKIFDENGNAIHAKNINQYLTDAPNVFIESRTKPLYNAPEMCFGNMANDGGSLIFLEEEKINFVEKNPDSEKYFRLFLGAEEFINGQKRYCLWLKGVNPSELKNQPEILKRISAVREHRLASRRISTQKFAETPMIFAEIRQPDTDYLLVPRVSSERRKYVPIGFITDENIIVSDRVHIIPDATLYHFGVLTSNVHMAWMRAVCGRLKSDYNYSTDIVYNNFPWPDATDERKCAIERAAQEVLNARAKFPTSSLADLYDPLIMPPELTKAHNQLDKAVMQLYGYSAKDFSETTCVADLMQRYLKLTEKASV